MSKKQLVVLLAILIIAISMLSYQCGKDSIKDDRQNGILIGMCSLTHALLTSDSNARREEFSKHLKICDGKCFDNEE